MKTYKISSIKKIIDGDTVDVMIDLGFDVMIMKRIRLFGIDAPESRTSDQQIKQYGLLVKEQLQNWCTKVMLNNDDSFTMEVIVHDTSDKFGRILGELIIHDNQNKTTTNINKWLCDNHYAISFYGDTNKEERTSLHKTNWKQHFLFQNENV